MNDSNSNVHSFSQVLAFLLLGVFFLMPVNLSLFGFERSLNQTNPSLQSDVAQNISGNHKINDYVSYHIENIERVKWEHHEEEVIIRQNVQFKNDNSDRYIVSVIVSPWQSNGRLTVNGGSAIAFAGGSSNGLSAYWVNEGDAWFGQDLNLRLGTIIFTDNSLSLSYYSIRQGYVGSNNTIKANKVKKAEIIYKDDLCFFFV